ncbi:hypothetical protein FF3_01950 [Fretibacterium fastidiosum]
MKNYYDEKYFDWQRDIGSFGGWANRTKFESYISPGDRVLDFGGGGGYLMAQINCAEKRIVEINASAREQAKAMGIEGYAKSAEVADAWADVIISNNALEHTDYPLKELEELHRVLRPGGKIIFVVPCSNYTYAYKANDINQHLYSWSPMDIGNLFTRAGFHVLESKPYRHKWPPYYRLLARGGRRFFDLCCWLYARWETTWAQVRVVAEK